MKHVATIREQDLNPGAVSADTPVFSRREAARAVVFDGPKVALLKVRKRNYYKLPGGGIEPGEDAKAGLAREALEEIGCRIEITGEVGEIIEYRDQWELQQTSSCFLARKIGETQPPEFTAEELDDGFEIVWSPDIATAIKLVKEAKPANYDGTFIQRRDGLFLEAAKQVVAQPLAG